MWMEVHIYSVKAKSQTGNVWLKDITTTASHCKYLRILLENSAEGLRSGRECYKNKTEKLSRIPLKVDATLFNSSRKGAVGAW